MIDNEVLAIPVFEFIVVAWFVIAKEFEEVDVKPGADMADVDGGKLLVDRTLLVVRGAVLELTVVALVG